MIDEIKAAWGWLGIEPREVVAVNAFGNIVFKDASGRYWRLCPEDLSCGVIAEQDEAYALLLEDPDFLLDWEMELLVKAAREAAGQPREGWCYCLKIPGPLGGEYASHNLATVPLRELIRFSGRVAREIEDLPDGSQVAFRIVE